MPSRWEPSTKGEEELLVQLSQGANRFADLVVDRVKAIETGLERYTFHGRRPAGHYRDTITQGTYLNGVLIGGRDVAGAARPRGDTIHSRVYTTSFLGHLLEVTGAQPHLIPRSIVPRWRVPPGHPGFVRRPHFIPGLLSAVSEAGVKMRGTLRVSGE